MIRRPPRSTLFPYTTPLPILAVGDLLAGVAGAGGRGLGRGAVAVVPGVGGGCGFEVRLEEHTSELQSRQYLVCRLLLDKEQFILFLDFLSFLSIVLLLSASSF